MKIEKVNVKEVVAKLSESDLVLGYKDKLLAGVNYLCDMVKVTLGAKGKTVMFRNKQGKVSVTKDGVTVAKQCVSDDRVEQMAIEIVREASERTVKTSGDGTTTTAVLAQYLVNRGFELMQQGHSYYNLAKGMTGALEEVVEKIRARAIKISENENFERLLDVATISSNSREIGEFVYDIMREIGVYGAIEIKKSNNVRDRIEKVKGIKFHKGFYAPHFVNDLTKMAWKAKDVSIVLYDDTIRTMGDIMPYVEAVGTGALLFIVNDIESTVLQTIINNRLMNPTAFNIMFVEHDGFGDRKTEIMNDIAAMTGATVCTSEFVGELGYAQEVYVDAETTSLLGGEMQDKLVEELIEITKRALDNPEIDDDTRLYYKRRLATLAGGVAVIHVGGVTEVEMNEKRDRIEDAVEAVKAAIERGVVIGGGYEFIKINSEMCVEGVLEDAGRKMVLEALVQPFGQLMKNAGMNADDVQVLGNHIASSQEGYDLIGDRLVSLDEYNVYDPAGVLIDSLSNAVAVAKSIMSIEGVCI